MTEAARQPLPVGSKADWYEVYVDYSSDMPPGLMVLISYENGAQFEVIFDTARRLIETFESEEEARNFVREEEGTLVIGRMTAEDHEVMPTVGFPVELYPSIPELGLREGQIGRVITASSTPDGIYQVAFDNSDRGEVQVVLRGEQFFVPHLRK